MKPAWMAVLTFAARSGFALMGSWSLNTVWVGTFLAFLIVSLRASGAQLGLDLVAQLIYLQFREMTKTTRID